MAFLSGKLRTDSGVVDHPDYANRIVVALASPAAAGALRRLYLVISGRDGRLVAVREGDPDQPIRLDRIAFKGEHLLGPYLRVNAAEHWRWLRLASERRATSARRARALCKELLPQLFGLAGGSKTGMDRYGEANKVVLTLSAPDDADWNPRRLFVIASVEDGKPIVALDGRFGWLHWFGRTGFEGPHLLGPCIRVSASEYERCRSMWGPNSRYGIERRAHELCRQDGSRLERLAEMEAFARYEGAERKLAAALWLLWQRRLIHCEIHGSEGVCVQVGPYWVKCDRAGSVTFEPEDEGILAAASMALLANPIGCHRLNLPQRNGARLLHSGQS